jgi:copper transport protein
MFEREKAPDRQPGWRLVAGYRKWLAILVFLTISGVLSGCGASALAPTPTPLLSRPQPITSTGPFHTTAQTFDGDFTITLDITPNHSGPNQFKVQVMDNHAHKIATHVTITLYTTMQDMPMGTDSVVLQAEEGGKFSATSNVLSMGGHWAIGITVQTGDHVIHKAGVNIVTP